MTQLTKGPLRLGVSFFFSAMSIALISGCGPYQKVSILESRVPQTAPIETGKLVTLKGTPDELHQQIGALESWASDIGARVRVVSEAVGVVEVFGASQDEVVAILPSATVEENVYFPHLLNGSRRQLEAFADDAAEGMKCTTRDPTLAIQLGLSKGGPDTFDRGVATLGSSFSLMVREKNAAPVTFFWIASGPTESRYHHVEQTGTEFEVTTDIPGSYDVLIVAARGDGRCLGRVFRFGVTTSEEFAGTHAARHFDASDRSKFVHLGVIEAEAAWAVTRGKGVTVAVIDTGVNFNHPDLTQNVAVDANGALIGSNFWLPTARPFDDHGHGTHVAGLSASAVMGIAPEATIIPIKALNSMGGGDLSSLVAAIRFAGQIGADVINASFGGESDEFTSIRESIEYATSRGSLFVVAAGNGDEQGNGFSIDVRPVYPAALGLPGQLTVAATRFDGALSVYSNFGDKNVDVAAPGGDPAAGQGPLMSAYYLPGRKLYVGQMGTSMATPVTAGVAALVKSLHPQESLVQLKARLIAAGHDVPALAGKVRSGKLLNARLAVSQRD